MGHQERILVVEDNQQLRNMLINALGRLGHQVLEAHNSQSAQRVIEQGERFDLVLSDVIMPDLSGIELMRWLHRHAPGLRVLLMSGHTGDASSTLDMETWSTIQLRKPFTLEALAQKVHWILGTQ